jgi:hypothetical protein
VCLINTIEQYKERVRDSSLTTTPDPTPRQDLSAANASSGAWKRYDILGKLFITEEHWGAETLKVIERNFPAAILEKKSEFNMLPLEFTVNDVINRVPYLSPLPV